MRISLLIGCLTALITLSCKKERICECTVKQSYGGFSQSANSTSSTPKMTKKDAREYCKSSTNNSMMGLSQSVECELKE
jgi:hypothetical protein